ncbi:MAG: pilus assembly protein TadG-related protein, partial [Terriglobia bacterium]
MKQNCATSQYRPSERGATLYIVAGAMVVLLGISALAIDLVSFYLARAQAQRAADAGALAGASIFVSQGCLSTGGCSAGGPQEASATQQAVTIASQNLVAGLAPAAATIGTAFNYPNPEEPQINVTVYRDAAHGNPLPTYFGKIFGIATVNVSATAWAEAYSPSGTGGVSIGVECIRPFLVPNCDPNHPVLQGNPEANLNCACGGTGQPGDCSPSGDYMENYFDPTTGAVVNPGDCLWNTGSMSCTGKGVVGAYWQLHDNAAPSQWYTIAFTGQSGAAYRQNIFTCAPQAIACNPSLNTLNGKKVGPTDQGIQTLIHAGGDGLNQGQDVMCASTAPYCLGVPPFTITGGSNNPYG